VGSVTDRLLIGAGIISRYSFDKYSLLSFVVCARMCVLAAGDKAFISPLRPIQPFIRLSSPV